MQAVHGRRLPAEWEMQRVALLTWPHAGGDWGDNLAEVEQTFLRMAEAILGHQPLVIACSDQPALQRLQSQLAPHGAPDIHVVPSNDIWVRDHGPITVVGRDDRPRLLDFKFNGWGGKYPAEKDDRLTRHLHATGAFGDLPLESVPWILEGGSLETDGRGTLLTTSSCLLTDTRNPGTDKGWWEDRFAEWFGVDRVLWLDHGHLEGDDTDGHVDMLARFVDPETIVYTACDDPDDPHYDSLARMADQLRAFRSRSGKPYHLIPLPWPSAHHDETGERLPLSYANFLVINGAVLLPCYAQPQDQAAENLLAPLFPGRELHRIPALPLIRQHGSVHCATQQIVR